MKLSCLIQSCVSSVVEGPMDGPDANRLYETSCHYLFDNGLFQASCTYGGPEQGLLIENPSDITLIKERLEFYLAHSNDSAEKKESLLLAKIGETFPATADRLGLFREAWEWKGDGAGRHDALDYLAAAEKKEVHMMDDSQLRDFAEEMLSKTTCGAVRYFADFALWSKEVYKDTLFTVDLEIGSRSSRSATMPYSLEQIIKFHYFCFNEEYIKEQDLYARACTSRLLAHCLTWISIHLISAIRDTDLVHLPHPDIPEEPEKLLARIQNGSFTEEEARQVALSMMEELDRIPLVPNKTRRFQYVPNVFLRIGGTLEVHFGTLFAIDECFFRMDGDPDAPLFQPVKKLSAIRKAMGDEVAAVFNGNDACPTAFSKSFMQILGIMGARPESKEGPGNVLFALGLADRVRSHKGGYGTVAASTYAYMRDCVMGTLTPEMAMEEALKRGVMSCHLGHFISLLTNKDYERLDFSQQTMMIHSLGLSPLEAERAMSIYRQAMADAEKSLASILSHLDPDEQYAAIKEAMKNLATRMTPGKDKGALCFVVALEKPCLHPDYGSCLACPYRIDTRATLYHAVRELRRFRHLKKHARTAGERMKYDLLTNGYIIPLLAQASMAALEMFGEEAQAMVDGIIIQALKEEFEEGEE